VNRIALVEVADASARTILAAIDEPMSGPARLRLGTALFGDRATVSDRPAFPILLSRAVRRLAGWAPPPFAVSAERAAVDPVWVCDVERARATLTAPGDRRASDSHRTAPDTPAAGAFGSTSVSMLTVSQLMLVLALILLVLEAVLHARGRIV
jgi:hypothetical protein